MFQTLMWIVTRFFLPLLAAGCMMYSRWGKDNIAFILTLPILFLLLRMFMSSQEWPNCSPLDEFLPFRRAIIWWHTLEVLALVLLMGFEIGIAAAASGQDRFAASIVTAIFLLPYAVLILVARRCLRYANQLAKDCRNHLQAEARSK